MDDRWYAPKEILVPPDENEQLILQKALEGDFPAFKILLGQIAHLSVKSKIRSKGYYVTNFDLIDANIKRLNGCEAFMDIWDTMLCLEEESELCAVEVTIMRGYLCGLRIWGKEHDFQKPFTIKEIFWEDNNSFRKEGVRRYYHSAKDRNLLAAIGYIPTYK